MTMPVPPSKKKGVVMHNPYGIVYSRLNSKLRYVVNTHNQGILYFQNAIWFYDTCTNIISFMVIKK